MKNRKSYIIFLLFSLGFMVFSESNVKDENTVKSGKDISESFLEKDRKEEVINENSDEELIYLDQIKDEEEEKEKLEKPGRITRLINKIDDKVNPVLKFYTPSSYGSWYLIKTTNTSEAVYENIKYNFKQEENGYRIVKTYYIPEAQMWMESSERGWIKEKKGKVYLMTENKLFKSYTNEIIYFDSKYEYMIVRFESDGSTRVFSRFPVERIMLSEEEKEKFEDILGNIGSLHNVVYNSSNINLKDERLLDKENQEERARIIEKMLIENPDEVFKIN